MSVNPSEAGISHDPNPSRLGNRNEYAPVIEELNRMEGVWWGSDLEVCKDTLIEPGEKTAVKLKLTRESLPPIDIPNGSEEVVIQNLKPHIRSRYANVGTDILFLGAKEKGRRLPAVNLEEGTVTATVMSLGGRPIFLPEGEGLLSFFSIGGNADYLQGERLFKTAKPLIHGKFGKAWYLIDSRGMRPSKHVDVDGLEHATALALILDRTRRFWIPPSRDSVTLAGEEDYRSYLSRKGILVHLGKRQPLPTFWVSETEVKVNLPEEKGIIGQLSLLASSNGKFVSHLESPFLKNGETPAWRVRVEIDDRKAVMQESAESEEAEDLYGKGIQYVVLYLIQQPQIEISG